MSYEENESEIMLNVLASYMRDRDKLHKPYGYLKYYNNIRKQVLFQHLRKNRFLCTLLFRDMALKPGDFFDDRYLYDAKQFIRDMKPRRDEYISHLDEYKEITASLADDISKMTLIGIINAALTFRYEWFEEVMVRGETNYWPSDIFGPDMLHNEVIADLGGCDGDSYDQFTDQFGMSFYDKYYLYEPDMVNADRAKMKMKDKKVVIKNCAVGNVNGTLTFNSLGGQSGRIEDIDNGIKVRVIRLDDDLKERITYIKMDIEGAERDAIEGASEHIRYDRPKLAICLYHLPDDIRVIINKVRELNPNYKLYIRHYSSKHKETVLYAV